MCIPTHEHYFDPIVKRWRKLPITSPTLFIDDALVCLCNLKDGDNAECRVHVRPEWPESGDLGDMS